MDRLAESRRLGRGPTIVGAVLSSPCWLGTDKATRRPPHGRRRRRRGSQCLRLVLPRSGGRPLSATVRPRRPLATTHHADRTQGLRQVRDEHRLKRGGGNVLGPVGHSKRPVDDGETAFEWFVGREPTPETAAQVDRGMPPVARSPEVPTSYTRSPCGRWKGTPTRNRDQARLRPRPPSNASSRRIRTEVRTRGRTVTEI